MSYTYKYKVGQEPKPCRCGCGELTKYPGANFVQGHQFRLKEFQYKGKGDIINTCKQCGVEFISKSDHRKKQDFCSKSCANTAKWCNGVFGNMIAERFEQRNCLFCNKEFRYSKIEGKRYPNRGKYCCKECQIKDWNKKSAESQAPGNYRANAWRTYERKCYDCGYNARPEILVIHHIDGNRKNGAISNLIPVCQNCHCLRHIELSGNHRLPSARLQKMLSD